MVSFVQATMEYYRRNMFTVIQESFKPAGRKTFIHRIMYIGEHKFHNKTADKYVHTSNNLTDYMSVKVKQVNDGYCDERLTGLFFAYPLQFIHIVEGSEDTLLHHLRLVCEDDLQFGHMNILMVSHHIRERIFLEWSSVVCSPSTLIDRIPPGISKEDTLMYIQNCIESLLAILDGLHQPPVHGNEVSLVNLIKQYSSHLPDPFLLEFLLNTSALQGVKSYLFKYHVQPDYVPYEERTWPAVCEFVPLHVLECVPKPSKLPQAPKLDDDNFEEDDDDDDDKSESSLEDIVENMADEEKK